MKRNFNKVLSLILCTVMLLSIVGCTKNEIQSPEDAIKDAYGDTQFKISFDSSSLEEPLKDIYYSAKNMPILPTPKKVGYVFAGWYFNSSLTEPCNVSDGDLLWKMKNLTLYPKWEEEQIVNNGTYEIEYNAEIIEDSIVKGPLAQGYQKFVDNIIKSETYIEKNEKGTFLRIQYDNVVRGPVLGSSGADPESNFSKMTYTVTDDDHRINKDISILDRTNTIQTIYYDLKDLRLKDTITLHIEYYNWKINIDDTLRDKATVRYDIKFNINKFIGFDQSFVNPEGRLDNGIYVIPTHYTALNKTTSMLDMFNPVYAYILAKNGQYTLYKPLNSYNNDFPNITSKEYPLRTSGYAREFACFTINKDKKIDQEKENDITGEIFMPEEIGATKYRNMVYEFHADTGRYYYSIDLGNTLDNDVVFIGGSSGAMEQMFSFYFSYRRLSLDYHSMVKIVDWDYEPLKGDEYKFKDKAAMYLGNTNEFNGTNKVVDMLQNYKQVVNMTNVFFTRTNKGNVDKVFDTKMVISVNSEYRNPSESKGRYSVFDISYSAFDYDPITDGELYARDLSFLTNLPFRYTNSFVNKKMNGKTLNIGDKVNMRDIYKEKVSSTIPADIKYTAYDLDDNLNIIGEGREEHAIFNFEKNVAIHCVATRKDRTTESALVYLVKEEKPSIKVVGDGWALDEKTGIYKTNKKFEIKSFVDIPEVLYTYYGSTYTTKGLKKDFDELAKYGDSELDQSAKHELPRTDFTVVSAWKYSRDIYTPMNLVLGEDEELSNKKIIKHDFIMGSENVRVMMQLTNQFGEFEPIMLEFESVNSGKYELYLGDKIVDGSDILYIDSIRKPIDFKMQMSYHIGKESDIYKIPTQFNLKLVNADEILNNSIPFSNAVIYLKNNIVKVENISEIWEHIKNENYALISLLYANDYGDKVEYKAEYNFRLDNKIVDKYFTIRSNTAIFDGEEFDFINPVVSGYDYTILGRGKLKLYKKYGNKYLPVKREDGQCYSTGLNSSVKLNTSGKYLLCWEFALTTDENGEIVFSGVDPHSQNTYIRFGISQEIEVIDKNSEAKLTYATDKAHPFDEIKKQELISQGFVFSEDAEYQYLTVPIWGDKISFTLTNDYLASPDYALFGWGDKKGNVQYPPHNQVQNIASEQKTLEPILYAIYNVPLEVELEYDFDGKIYKPFDGKIKIMRKNLNYVYEGECRKFYVTTFFDNLPEELKGYEIYGWKTSIPVLKDYVEIDGRMVLVYTDNITGNYNKEFAANKPFKITAVFKKSVFVGYEAVKDNPNSGETLQFMDRIETDYDLLSNDRLSKKIPKNKMSVLNNAKVTDISLTFKYWTAFDKTQNKWVKIDLDTFVLEDKYTNSNGKITLRAVFG